VTKVEKTIEFGTCTVKSGMDHISNAKEESIKLGTLQESSLTVVEDITLACEDSRLYMGRVVDMAENMTELMGHSADMIQEIR